MLRTIRMCAVAGALLLGASNAFAAGYGMAGCGLGSSLMGADGNQLSASTTNGLSGNQTLGITTGTSNCVAPEAAAALDEQQKFVTTNLSTFSKEAAQGSGDSLQAFSQKLGCAPDVYGDVNAELQANYDEIFAAPGAIAVLKTAKAKLRKNDSLNTQCSYLTI